MHGIDCQPVYLFQYLGSRGAQHKKHLVFLFPRCFNTWAREEPNLYWLITLLYGWEVSILGLARSPTRLAFNVESDSVVSILGLARSPTQRQHQESNGGGFNTWAREEPNKQGMIPAFHAFTFQYLGSRGAQRTFQPHFLSSSTFQYLGSRGAQLRLAGGSINILVFQYLGSRGAQPG